MSLVVTLAGLVAAARCGRPQRITLARSLRVDVRVTETETHLLLSRVGRRPSLAEWRTVIEAWPYRAPAVEPVECASRDGLRLGLRSAWLTPLAESSQLTAATTSDVKPQTTGD